METDIARLMLENLIDRIEANPQTRKKYLSGAISDREYEALGFALAAVGGDPTPMTAGGATPLPASDANGAEEMDSVSAPKPQSVKLILESLDIAEAQDRHVLLCLDFGTAMSKAFATIGSDDDLLPLAMGRRAGESSLIFPVSSTLFFSRKGKVLFGPEAIRESCKESDPTRLRFESPKQNFSRGDIELVIEQFVGKEVNPSQFPFTKGELITLYLAYLTDLACAELEEQGLSRYVARRFATPSWQPDRASWADQTMRKMLAKGQILADTFKGRWSGGIGAAEVRGAFDALAELSDFPDYLIHEGVVEAIAAASSGLPRATGERRLYMVVDVGAGTTDFGLFAVVSRKGADERPKVFELSGSTKVLRQAGDKIDTLLLRHIRDQKHLEPGHPDYDIASSFLLRRIRDWKETLFREGKVSYFLDTEEEDGGTVSLEDFLNNEGILQFSKNIRETFIKALEAVDPSWLEGLGPMGLTVLLTGGGAKLPMVQVLGEGNVKVHGMTIRCNLAPFAPAWITEKYSDLVDEYPQLAVSIGGAAEEFPEKGPSYSKFGIMTGPPIAGLETAYKGV